ncbi:hypothetical protein NDU88_005679 [Pleurodeles waltl]|uniref:Uncharacterized protein n=1 Tax=Pleurodeles waltl TaxID=8319 RepID=A0AAV7NPP1_PLEWA|nr:hypothetical protein NDU88_005679 [Pleurodeles waltl]
MYHTLYYDTPIRHLYRGGTNAIKSTAETVFTRETTHLSTLKEEPRRHGARIAHISNAGLPLPTPGTQLRRRRPRATLERALSGGLDNYDSCDVCRTSELDSRKSCPQDHKEVLLWASTTAAPEPEKEPREPEIEQELEEDSSITPVRDESEDLQDSEEESISMDTAGEPSSAGILPEANGVETQTEQFPDQEGE